MRISSFILVACMVLFPVVGVSQDTTKILVPKSILTNAQIVEASTQNLTPESMSKWAGAGKEVGIGVNSALGAITEQAAKFGETKIGKITIFLVVWKVIGNELMDYIVALALMVIGVPTIIWSMKRYLPRNVVKTEERNEKGKVIKTTYEARTGSDDAISWHWGLMIALTLLSVVICV